MMIKIGATTEADLSELQKTVAQQTGMMPQSNSLIVEVVLQWALKRMRASTVRTLAPRMLSLSQRRKAVVSELKARQNEIDGTQITKLMKTIGKAKKISDRVDASISEKQI